MKNDLDFIKDKIENSGVSAPAEMDENHVLKKLEGIEPNSAPILSELKPKKNHARLIAGLAAAFVAVVALSVFAMIRFRNYPGTPPEMLSSRISADIPLKTFSDYSEVREELKKITTSVDRRLDIYEKTADAESYDSAEENGSGSSGSSKTASGGSESYSETYKQVEGVDEADLVKTDGKYLYIASENGSKGIDIFSATDDPMRVATVYPENFDDPMMPAAYTDDEDDLDVFVEEMYLYGDKLIAVCKTRGEHFTYNTMAAVYDVSDVKKVNLVDRFHQSGDYTTTRLIGDTLYLVSEESVYDEDEFTAPLCYRGEEKQEIPIENVCCVEEPASPGMLIIGGYDLQDGAKDVQSAAVIGSVEDVYCNESNMYLYTTDWHYSAIVDYEIYDGDPGTRTDSYMPSSEKPVTTDIYKVSLKDGISFTAYASVNGWLDSRYSLDEKDGFLRVAATTEDKNYDETNSLYILDKDLKEVGKVTGIAKNEEIKAVRYAGDVAYVITYEETDPLFVIDLSDPKSPTVLGEVKIDGFSTMLIPVDENTLLGVGVYTEDADYTAMQVENGTKLALFDVSDKLHPKVLDEKIYRSCESEAIYEPRAFVKNPDRGDYLIPLNRVEYQNQKNAEYDEPIVYGGALNFRIENGKIVEIAHPEVKTTRDYDDVINRCLYVGDNIYLIYNGYYDETAVYAVKYQ